MSNAAYAMHEQELDRGKLLLRGALLLGSGGALAALAGPAAAAHADTVPDGDLAYLRLLVAVELLKIDFGVRAVTAGNLHAGAKRLVDRLVIHDKRHYVGLAALLRNAGQTPAS